MNDHFHTGFVHLVFAGASAIIVIQVMRLAAAQLVDRPQTERVGRVIGALVTFN